jgi:PhnB protein
MKPEIDHGDFVPRVTATLSVLDWAAAMRFYQAAFDARETCRVPGGGVGSVSVGGAEFWVAEESREHKNFSPASLGGCSVRMLLIVADPERICRQAIAAGATEVVPVSRQHGWILGRIVDPFGHDWEVGRPSD